MGVLANGSVTVISVSKVPMFGGIQKYPRLLSSILSEIVINIL
jgi:hypothetical protein